MKKNWIDSKLLREQLNFATVLEHYGVELRVRKENKHQGFCPLPGHGGSGERRSPSFSADLETGIFQCFGCGGKGNIIDFAILMAGESKDDKQAFRRASVMLKETFIDGNGAQPAKATTSTPKKNKKPKVVPTATNKIINPPLSFSLQNLQTDHPYLKERDFEKEIASHFGAGYCSTGMMKNRIAFPLHNQNGELIGYAGRIIDDNLVDEDTPKYRFPGARTVDDTVHEFHKSEFLYNGHLITKPVKHLAIVEGFFHVWRLHQAGIPAVSVMGSNVSDKQVDLILSLTKQKGCLWFIPDPDEAGSRRVDSCLSKLATKRYVRILELPEGKDVADLSIKETRSLFPSKATE